jgi:hypothetical protein
MRAISRHCTQTVNRIMRFKLYQISYLRFIDNFQLEQYRTG